MPKPHKGISLPFSEDIIELSGNTDAYFDHCRRLLECSEMLIQLQTNAHTVSIWGKALTANDYSAHGLHISGEIAVIEFDGGLQ